MCIRSFNVTWTTSSIVDREAGKLSVLNSHAGRLRSSQKAQHSGKYVIFLRELAAVCSFVYTTSMLTDMSNFAAEKLSLPRWCSKNFPYYTTLAIYQPYYGSMKTEQYLCISSDNTKLIVLPGAFHDYYVMQIARPPKNTCIQLAKAT